MATNVQIITPQSVMLLGSPTNASLSSGFTAVSITDTVPTVGVNGGNITILSPPQRNLTSFLFFGAGADNSKLDAVIWRVYKKENAAVDGGFVYIPHVAASLVDCVLSTFVGVSGEVPSASDRFADAVTSSEIDTANRTTEISSPVNTPFNLVVDAMGCEFYIVSFKNGTSTSATSANFLYIGD